MATGLHRIVAVVLAGLFVAANDRPEEIASDAIHSDLPLFRDSETLWPKHFVDGQDFGCTSRVRFGDWALITGDGEDAETVWLRIENYGVFHCAALVSESNEQVGLDKSAPRISFFVELGPVLVGSANLELWALQIGTTPGSDYLLLAREKGPDAITTFTVLQRECPRDRYRDAGRMDTFGTGYCAINSGPELIALARIMAKRRPLGRMEIVGDPIPERIKSSTDQKQP